MLNAKGELQMATYGYLRVSTKEQNNDRQEFALLQFAQDNKFVYDTIYQDKISGTKFVRDQYTKMKALLQSGDSIVIKSIDRLGRNWAGIKDEWRWFMDKDIKILVVDMPMLSSTYGATNIDERLVKNIVFEMYCFLAQKERDLISERTKEGIAVAKSKGKILGRPKEVSPEVLDKAVNDYLNGMTYQESATENNMNYMSLYNECKLRGAIRKRTRKNKEKDIV